MFTPDKGKKAQVSVRLRAGSTKGGPYVATLGSTGEFLAGSSVHLVFIGRPTHSVLTVPLIVDVWSGPAGSTEWQLSERSRSFVVWVGSDGIGEVVVDIPRDTPPGAYCFIPVDDRGTCKPIRVADSRGPLPEGIAGQLESTPSFTGAGSEFLAIVGALLLLTGCLLVLGAKRLETHET